MSDPGPERLSQRDYAKRRGCAPSAVARAVKEGRITLIDGKIEPTSADRQWRERSKARADSEPGEPGPRLRPEGVPEVSYSDARARREHLNAQQAELNLQQARGALIDKAQAEKAVFDAFHDLRDALSRLPRRVSGLVIGLTDAREVERIVGRELKSTLEAFARPTTEALRRRT